MIPIRHYADRDVAVFGLARTGRAAAKALAAGGARVHAWDDSEAARADALAEGVPLSDINARDWRGFAALVLSPGVPLDHPEPHRVVALARAVGVPVIGDVELFAGAVNALAPHQRPKVIGVTGTNGKSTTTALIGHALKEAGKDARVGGNIGQAALDLAPLHAGAFYVLELSSFQLDLVSTLRCDVAVWLNTTPDHLDRHGSMENYIAAKRRILANQGAGDWAVIGVDDAIGSRVCTELIAHGARQVAPISSGQALSRGVCALGGKLFDALGARADQVFDLAEAPNLKGAHNAQNAAAAYAALRAFGLERRVIAAAFTSFKGLPHRLEEAGIVSGVRFINDSKATNADAAAQALAVFPRVYWIAGGVAKEGGVEGLQRFFSRLAGVYLIGKAAKDFARTLEGQAPVVQCGDLEHAVAQAFADAKKSGDPDPVVLLSPACASYDQFRDYEARGDAFKALVAKLALAPSMDASAG
ncbi:MAG: UDP-N-acetylmuramoyl-L-alanine--D-glutamate ligase [Hydrogenophilaceae bacterium]|jgi:UDP-N-acetylmuramoylalanine--D-glutamate ligase|nr:UDP-N-acetylmuramoyl-L-alanine--D-glutamate ligase [Hydrogenophilaceae bacterium]